MAGNKFVGSAKAQVTAFIIIGIVILAIVWAALYFSDRFSTNNAPLSGQNLELQSQTIKADIDNCVQLLTDKAVKLIAYQGLYLDIPQNSYKYNDTSVYWIKNTVNVMPHDFAAIENDIAYYVNSNLPGCVNFDSFRNNGWSISSFNPLTKVGIYTDDIGVEVNYTIEVQKLGFDKKFSNSAYRPTIRLRKIYERSVDFLNNQLLGEKFDINDPLKNYDSGGYVINYTNISKSTRLFSITDLQSKFIDGTLTLKFIANFDMSNIPRTYDASSYLEQRKLYSPDRLAVLTLSPGLRSSSDNLKIEQYTADSVKLEHIPSTKTNDEYSDYITYTYVTDYPIYRFTPNGNSFTNGEADLGIYISKDKSSISGEQSLIYNEGNGWHPYINEFDGANIQASLQGFSDYTAIECSNQQEETYKVLVEDNHVWIVIMFFLALFLFKYNFIIAIALMALCFMKWNEVEKKGSMNIQAICDDDITIKVENVHSKSCKCVITDSKTGQSYGSPTQMGVKAGKWYNVEGQIKGATYFYGLSDCTCFVTGLILSTDGTLVNDTNSTNSTSPTGAAVMDFRKITGAAVSGSNDNLVCCKDKQGYCLENYLESECKSQTFQRICAEIKECNFTVPTSKKLLQVTDSNNNARDFFYSGTTLLVNAYLHDAPKGSSVFAHIKDNGTEIDLLQLFDDGKHDDSSENDGYYANTLNSFNLPLEQTYSQISWDIEIVGYSTITDAGSSLIIREGAGCLPVGSFSAESSLDIIFASRNYNEISEYNQKADEISKKIMSLGDFEKLSKENKLNFYSTDNPFTYSDINEITNYISENCGYSNPSKKLVIALNKEEAYCTQSGNIVQLNDKFNFKPSASTVPIEIILADFCSYIDENIFMNPPKANILEESYATEPGNITIHFNISDEEYPIGYNVLLNGLNLPIVNPYVNDNSMRNITIPLQTNGTWTIEIEATDKKGNTGYSNPLVIVTQNISDQIAPVVEPNQIVLNFSSISPLNINKGSYKNINLADYVYDPLGEKITGWEFYPKSSSCLDVSTISITDGILPVKSINGICQEMIVIEASGSDDRKAYDIIQVNVI